MGGGWVVTQTQRIFFYLGPHSYGISSVSASNSPSVSLSPPSTPSSNTCMQVHNYNYKCVSVLLFSSTPSIQVHNYSHTSPSLSPSSLSTPSSNTWYKYTTTLSITITHGSDCIKGRKHCTTAGKQQPQLNLMVITGRILLSVLLYVCSQQGDIRGSFWVPALEPAIQQFCCLFSYDKLSFLTNTLNNHSILIFTNIGLDQTSN